MSNDLSLYYKVRPLIRSMDLFQWKSHSPLGLAIRWRTGGDRPGYEVEHGINVNHSSLAAVMREVESGDIRYYTTEALGSGIVPNYLSVRLEKFNGEVWWYPLKDEFNDERGEMARRSFNNKGIDYDYKAIVKKLIGLKTPLDKKNLYCNEACCVTYDAKVKDAHSPNWLPTLGMHKEPIKILG